MCQSIKRPHGRRVHPLKAIMEVFEMSPGLVVRISVTPKEVIPPLGRIYSV